MRLALITALGLCACAAAPLEPPTRPTAPSHYSGQQTAGIDEAVRLSRLRIIPIEVIEDSRCPSDVVCVWAGRLVVRVMVQSPDFPTRTESMELGRGIALEDARSLTITSAEPVPRAGVAIQPSDYRLTFTLGPGD